MPNAQIHPVTLNQDSEGFAEGPSFSANEMSLDSNQWNQAFKLSVEEGEGYLPGRGQSRNPLQAQGFVAARFMDNTATTAVQISGKARLVQRTSGSGRLVRTLETWDLGNIDSRDSSGNLKDKKNREPFPVAHGAYITKEYDIWLELKPDSDTTVDTAPDSGNTEVIMDASAVERTS